jgi:hypothetical protein
VTVRRALALASEFGDQPWSSTVELSDEPAVAAWQLAGIAPLGPLDQVALLRSATMQQLLLSVIELTEAAGETLRAVWPNEEESDEFDGFDGDAPTGDDPDDPDQDDPDQDDPDTGGPGRP